MEVIRGIIVIGTYYIGSRFLGIVGSLKVYSRVDATTILEYGTVSFVIRHNFWIGGPRVTLRGGERGLFVAFVFFKCSTLSGYITRYYGFRVGYLLVWGSIGCSSCGFRA